MKYTLMHKNHRTLDVEIDNDSGSIVAAGDVYCAERIPVGISVKDGKPELQELKAWWSHRSIPISRSGIGKALETMGIGTTSELLTKCMGLSLSDSYWVRPESSDLAWENVNFFDNDFSDDVGNILFGEKSASDTINMMSPDGSSDGWLKKKWKITDGERVLVKGGSNFFQEPFNEVIASRIADRLGLNHVTYSIGFEGKNQSPVCICKDFADGSTELISASAVNRVLPTVRNESKYEHFVRCCEFLKIPNITKSLDEMLTLDFIIANQDRHMGNFGVLRNSDTLEYIGFAPIFDCGTSLRYDTPSVYIDPALNVESQPFVSFHDEQIRLVSNPQAFDLSRLVGIEKDIAGIFGDERAAAYIDKARQEKIIGIVTARISRLEQIFDLAKKEILSEEQDFGMTMR